jgi:hypothetical protein
MLYEARYDVTRPAARLVFFSERIDPQPGACYDALRISVLDNAVFPSTMRDEP